MKVAKDAQLNGREFGADIVLATELDAWLRGQHLPALQSFIPGETPDFVQLEYLLCAFEAARHSDLGPSDARARATAEADMATRPDTQSIERAVHRIKFAGREEEARGLAQTLLLDPAITVAGMDVKDLAPWLIGATAHRALRDLLRAAIARRELPLLDGTTWVLRELAPVEAPTHKKRWTPAHLQELSEYRGTHGTKVAANHFKISASLVRRLLPGEKPQRQGYSVYTHRPK